MTNTNDIASVLSTDLTAAIEQSVRQNETVRVATTLDISTVAAFAGDHADNVDYVRENDGSYDMWGWSDEMESAGNGEMLWRLNVTVAVQASDKVTVWHDDTSIESGYVVDAVDADGNTLTVNVCDDRDEAIAFGKQYAEQSKLAFEDLTDE